MYCSNDKFPVFIGSKTGEPRHARCPECENQTCRACRLEWHEKLGACLKGSDEAVILVLCHKWGYKRCPGCKRVVERTAGCDHMVAPMRRYILLQVRETQRPAHCLWRMKAKAWTRSWI